MQTCDIVEETRFREGGLRSEFGEKEWIEVGAGVAHTPGDWFANLALRNHLICS
jgi:hypothetical protein